MHREPSRSAGGRPPLPVILELPRIQFGLLSFGAMTGLELAAVLEPYLTGDVQERLSARRYPLSIQDGTGIGVPFQIPLLGEVELRLDYRDGRLWLGVPAIAMIEGMVLPHIQRVLDGAPQPMGRCTAYPLKLKAGDRLGIPLAGFGEIAVEVG